MKVGLVITLFFIAVGCNPSKKIANQAIDTGIDSLKKYSYLLSAYCGEYSARGTAFFIRSKGELFLLTSKHIVSGCNFPDSLYIWLHNRTGDLYEKPVDLRTFKENLKSVKQINNEPDIIAIPIHDTLFNCVYSVESFSVPRFKKPSSIEIYGYPNSDKNDWSNVNFYATPSHLHVAEQNYTIAIGVDSATNKKDKINYYIYTTNIPLDNRLKGYSGSPVFLKDDTKWCLLGCFVGHTITNDLGKKSIKIVRPRYILKAKNKGVR